jgi:hypothetical protein
MDNGFVFSTAHHLLHLASISNAGFYHLGVAVESADVFPLDSRIVKIVEIVESGDGMTVPQKSLNDMGSDEAGATGDKDLHRLRLIGL